MLLLSALSVFQPTGADQWIDIGLEGFQWLKVRLQKGINYAIREIRFSRVSPLANHTVKVFFSFYSQNIDLRQNYEELEMQKKMSFQPYGASDENRYSKISRFHRFNAVKNIIYSPRRPSCALKRWANTRLCHQNLSQFQSRSLRLIHLSSTIHARIVKA